MAIILTCRFCAEEHRRETDDTEPAICPHCGKRPSRWTAATVVDDPAVPYEVSDRGGRILRALWIDPERPLDGSREEG